MSYVVDCDLGYSMGAGVLYRVSLKLKGKEIGSANILSHIGKEYIEIGFIEVDKEYRGNGLSKLLHKEMARLYRTEELLKGKYIARKFVNPIAEKVAIWAWLTGLYPEDSWDEKYVERSY